MSRLFDRRHKWGPEFRSPGGFSRTCTVCGRTDTYDPIVPHVFVDAVLRSLSRPNPYRELFR